MRIRNRILWVLALGHGATHWHRGAMSVCLPLILKDLGMSYTQMGLIRSVQQIVAMVSTMAGGLATDILNQRKAMLIFSVIWPSFFFSFQGYATTFLVFAALVWAQMLFGGFLWHAPARAVIGEALPDRMGFGLGVHGMGGNLAQALAPLAVGGLLWFISWRAAFKLHLIPGILVGLLLWQLLPPLGRSIEGREESASYMAGFRAEVLGNIPFLCIALVGALRSVGENVIPTFLPLYLSYEMKMSTATIGVYLSSLAMVGTIAAPIVGHLSDRWGRKPTVFLCLLSGSMLITAIPWVHSPAILFSIVSLAGVVLFSVGPVIQAGGLDYTPRDLWGSAQSLMDIARSTLSLVFPLLAGAVADLYGLGTTFYLFGGVNLIAALAILPVPPRTRINPGSLTAR
ncbi:MAG: MFS transporter [Candidatus Binatia bacterium]